MEQRLHVGPPEAGSERERIFNESLGLVRDVILSVVKKRKDGTETEEVPFVDALLQSQVPDDQIISDAVTFMVGGLHTSGYLLVWATYYMSQHLEVLNSVVAEMRKEVGNDRSEKLYEYAYSTTSYLRKVLDETLRLSTLAPYAARYSEEDITVGEYSIPAGTPIIDALGVSLKNECLWKNVHKFDPEHFGSCALQSKDSMAFSPFGMGRRKCPGYQFSYVEVSIFLTLLLQRFNLKPVSDKGVGMVHGLVTSPSEPLYYTVHPIASDESTTEE
ncbi:PREDICTED: cytochrome P450 20A1-like [Amphimedon queenslandica]|uniref:Cytochrome P450 n=2 Tax=Amphimedon queenslandica TaxID=400682 RepID=A0AAN0IL12_AMPQE|nr:PREDICTED: cytochrome P450 20A1-like [Amphimedon queenslandica]|eukprot:XP_011402919.2 PREDICTED: cytochrome P450 20A1-like [Amphimedon queenslandica]